MRVFLRVALFSLTGFFLCLPVSAIVVADYSVATNAPTGDWDLNWDYVYYYKTMSSVAVGSHWLLTAGHAALEMSNRSSTVIINDVNYYEQAVYLHDPADDPSHTNIADLALVRFDKPFPGYYPLYTGSMINKSVVMVGYGNTGTVHSTYYTLSNSGSGVKRWGSNKIDQTYTLSQTINNYRTDPYSTVDTDTSGVLMYFTQSGTTYEAGAAVYDSGSGTFIKSGGIWKLAGINTAILQSDPGGPNITFAASIPAYAAWITQTIAAADGDDDSDGIPNWWEEQYTTNILASIDQDGDGVNGADEYVADTDPTDINSFFKVDTFGVSSNQTLTFTGSTAREYRALYTTNDLADPGLIWTTNEPAIWGVGTNTEIIVTNAEDRVFYRLKVILP